MNNELVYFQLPADDVQRAQEFYRNTFGWGVNEVALNKDEQSDEIGDSYYQITQSPKSDETPKITGGIVQRSDTSRVATNYIRVESIDDTLSKVKNNGGVVVMNKTKVSSEHGWIALFEDTEHNIIGLHEATA